MPPNDRVAGDWIDVANAGLLLVALFYLKVTYFAGGLAFVGLAILISPHVRARCWPGWRSAAGRCQCLAPWNHPYLLDLLHAAAAGSGAATAWAFTSTTSSPMPKDTQPYAAGLVVAVWMWARGLAPPRVPLAIAGILAVGGLVLSQNHQSHGLPVGIVIAFLLYDQIRERFGPAVPVLPMLMVFPLFAIGASALSLAGYHAHAGRQALLQVVERTQLKGLAVPAERPGLLAAFADGRFDPRCSIGRAPRRRASSSHPPNMSRRSSRRLPCWATIAIARRRRGPRPGQSLPLHAGLAAGSRRHLWSGPGAPVRPADEIFADATYVLIPNSRPTGPGPSWRSSHMAHTCRRIFAPARTRKAGSC